MFRLFPLLFLLQASCVSTYIGKAQDFDPKVLGEKDWVAVTTVPEIRQSGKYDCGAAALAMVLSYLKEPLKLEDVLKECPMEEGHGIKAGALQAFAKARGYQAFLIQGRMDDLTTNLGQGRPVIVGMLKPDVFGYANHFEVVVGVNKESQQVVTLDPARGYRINTFEGFGTEWVLAERLLLIIAPSAKDK